MLESILVKRQRQTFKKFIIDNGEKQTIFCNIRYDDQCGNGHNTFSITGDIVTGHVKAMNSDNMPNRRFICGGCIHEDIAKHFPEFAHLIKWHLCSSDGPMHYIANTIYHTRDTDHNGLKRGEYSAYQLHVVSDDISDGGPVTLYKTGQIYTNRQNNPNLAKRNEEEHKLLCAFHDDLRVGYRIEKVNSDFSLSEGKEIDLGAARSSAVWPDATIEQLSDKQALEARLPALLTAMRADVEALGMEW